LKGYLNYEKKCQNPNCRRSFTPNKFNVSRQLVCERVECKRYLANLRAKKAYRVRTKNPTLYKKHLAKKKLEREAFLLRSSEKIPSNDSDDNNLSTVKLNSKSVHLLIGAVSLISGCANSTDLEEVISKCIKRGANHFDIEQYFLK